MSFNNLRLISVLGFPIAAALIMLIVRPKKSWVLPGIAIVAIVLSILSVTSLLPVLRSKQSISISLPWIETLGISFLIQLDWLSFPYLITELAVTFVAFLFCLGDSFSLKQNKYYYILILLFSWGMSGTTLADDMFLFYIFWEVMLVTSCGLILLWGLDLRRETIALKYFIITHLGSLTVLVAMLILFSRTGSASLADLRASPFAIAPGLVTLIMVLFLFGFCTKMAIFPMHLWLPDAHTAAPMPVTIMLAAAMLSMGTYGILRFPFSFFTLDQLRVFAVPMMIVGLISEIYGALMALAERDIKRIIAYSSVSQMGYILFGLGSLTRDGITGASMHVIYHAIVKALLFIIVGIILETTRRKYIDELGGLSKHMPLVAGLAVVGVLGISGMPPLGIFTSEWMIFAGGFQTENFGLTVITIISSILSLIYALRFIGLIFFKKSSEPFPVKKVAAWALASGFCLAILLIITGIFPGVLLDWTSQGIGALLGGGL
ncbi:MAG: NADH-quinone oxidoreductase subunit M [Anaerolineaceae bacterium]|nr:NADH-quinone oxidoreductase subunit M [Anaerolineaceae bacterium]